MGDRVMVRGRGCGGGGGGGGEEIGGAHYSYCRDVQTAKYYDCIAPVFICLVYSAFRMEGMPVS